MALFQFNDKNIYTWEIIENVLYRPICLSILNITGFIINRPVYPQTYLTHAGVILGIDGASNEEFPFNLYIFDFNTNGLNIYDYRLFSLNNKYECHMYKPYNFKQNCVLEKLATQTTLKSLRHSSYNVFFNNCQLAISRIYYKNETILLMSLMFLILFFYYSSK